MNTRYIKFLSGLAIAFFCAFSTQAQMPGGVSNPNYTWLAWLTPDKYEAGTWTNLITSPGTVGNFAGAATAPAIRNTGYNFHPEVVFTKSAVAAAPNQLLSGLPYGSLTGQNITMIFVFQRVQQPAFDYLIGFSNTDIYNSLSWRVATNHNLTFRWGGTPDRIITDVSNGILTVSNSNATNTVAQQGILTYKNAGSMQTFASNAWNNTLNEGNRRIALGGGRNNQAWYGFRGEIQEVILLTNSGNAHIDALDLQKIHSYLAVKYGQTLGNTTVDILNSDGTAVWDRTANNGFNNFVFGIGRDDASRLNQVQSRSSSSDMLTLFKGSSLETLNNNNSTAFPDDKTFLMLGSNNEDTNNTVSYGHNAGAVFASGPINFDLNYRTALTYRAQITTAGVPRSGSQTTNIRVNVPRVRYMFVSSNPAFPAGATHVYPIGNGIITDVVINHGDYISFGGFQPLPGGVSGYTLNLWVDGNNSTNSSWTNLSSATHSLGRVGSQAAPTVRNSPRFNFHRELYFGNAANSKLQTTATYPIQAAQTYHAFVVSEQPGSGEAILLSYFPSTSAASARRTSLRWQTNNSVRVTWGDVTSTAANNANTLVGTRNFGIASMSVLNSNALNANNSNRLYLNGTPSTGVWASSFTSNVPLLVGNGHNTTGNTLPFNGTIQEIILMSGGNVMSVLDFQRVHTYLAIKYGIHLETGNYVASNGTTAVWDRGRTGYTDFNNHIFGVGRDDASGLNQVQSRSSNLPNTDNTGNPSPNLLTVFKGSSLETLNNNNSTAFPDDKTFLMLGSNNANINRVVTYEHNSGTVFENGAIDFRLNSRTQLVYRAQVTTAGVSGGSQTTNIHINDSRQRYVFVSGNSVFPAGATRIYPIVNGIATNVVVNHDDYISFGGFQPRPGGVSGYTLDLWVDGNNSTTTSWQNLASSVYSLGRVGTTAVPAVRNSKFNFHRELYFGNTTNSKLQTTATYPIQAAETYHAFVVSEQPRNNEAILLSYFPSTSAASARRTSLRWMTNNSVRVTWGDVTSTAANNANTLVGTRNFGIASMSVLNSNALNANNSNRLYLNGTPSTGVWASSFTSNVRLLVGDGNNTTSNALPFNGAIQEVILMRGGSVMPFNHIQRIHTYLAIKYGIHLQTGNYLASDETIIVWDRAEETIYNNHIFGIGRDDNSGLYQKQAQSASSQYLRIFIGNAPMPALNSQNTGVLDDMQYLMIGSSGGDPIRQLIPNIEIGAEYKNGTIVSDEDFNIQSPVYMAQFTGMTSISLKMIAPRDFLYAFVSDDDTFDPQKTHIYPITGDFFEIVLDETYRFFKFVGFAPGPGGVTSGLAMWLRADDDTGMRTTNLMLGDAALAGYNGVIGVVDSSGVQGVETWRDLARGHTYSWAAATNSNRQPVFHPDNPEMNFQPGVRFWAHGSTANSDTGESAFLGSTAGIMPPTNSNPDHTTILVLSHRYETTATVINAMFFAGASGTGYDAPGYAFTRRGTSGAEARVAVGRFRYGGGGSSVTEGQQRLFTAGAVSIMGYYVAPTRGEMYFRFNGVEESNAQTSSGRFTSNSIDMSRGSQLGRGYQHARSIRGLISEVIIYDKLLNPDEKRRVESYLALKYGVTLRPNTLFNQGPLRELTNPNNTGLFNYTFSNGKLMWTGETSSRVPQESRTLEQQEDVDFYNNIAAVVRDDGARLYTRQAHSTDAGSVMQMGIAGTKLTDDGEFLEFFDNNMEAVIWGSTDMDWEHAQFGSAVTETKEEDCGDFEHIFSRIWRVQKVLQDDRPIKMLVAARNNSRTSFGITADDFTIAYYNRLHQGNDFYLVIADSKKDMINRNFKRVVPMSFIDGKHQTNYTFSDSISYVTFGFKINASGCMGNPDADFQGSKKFDWTQWTSRTNLNRNTTQNVNLVVQGGEFGDLGDDIKVVSTSVSYVTSPGTYGSSQPGVRAYRGFPRSANSPERGSLEVRRRGGQPTLASDVVIRIEFNNPVMPEFLIAGLSGNRRTQEEVEITGWCHISNARFSPKLNYVGAPNAATYGIQGNKATVNKRVNANATNRNGQVRVEFQGGVNVVEIRYRITGRRNTSRQQIWISPLVIRPVPPPVPINEDGLGFAKRIQQTNVYTCDLVEYTFFIHNTNCDPKYVNFTDTLQSAYMSWDFESLGLDTINERDNPSIRINEYGGTQVVKIDSLLLPPSSVVRLTLAAAFSEDAPTGVYQNRASISYEKAGGTIVLPSFDRETLEAVTSCFAEQIEWKEPVEMEAVTLRPMYRANGIIDVAITFTNPNEDFYDSFLDIDFNEEFTLVPGSIKITDMEGNDITENFTENYRIILPASDDDQNFFSIVGMCYAVDGVANPPIPSECNNESPEGFTLPNGQIVISFQLQAPAVPEDELDNDDNPTGRKLPLEVNYSFSSGMDIPCANSIIPGGGSILVPFSSIERIITNRHVTGRPRR